MSHICRNLGTVVKGLFVLFVLPVRLLPAALNGVLFAIDKASEILYRIASINAKRLPECLEGPHPGGHRVPIKTPLVEMNAAS